MKRYCCCLFITLLTLLIPVYTQANSISVGARSAYTPAVDSLLLLMDQSTGVRLLDLYTELHNELYGIGDEETHIHYLRAYIDEAVRQKNSYEEAYARTSLVEAMYNYGMPRNRFQEEAELALKLIPNEGETRRLHFHVASMVIDLDIISANYENALLSAEKLYNKAKELRYDTGMSLALLCMGRAYFGLELFDKAESSWRESLQQVAENEHFLYIKGDTYSYLLDVMLATKRYQEALEVCKEYEAFISKGELSDDPGNLKGENDTQWFLIHLSYAGIYTGLRQFDLAEQHIAAAEALVVSKTNIGMDSLERVRFEWQLAQGHYEEAGKTIERIEAILGEDPDYHDKLSVIDFRARLNYQSAQYKNAAETYQTYIALSDSLQRIELASRLHELRVHYEVDKLELQQKNDQISLRASHNLTIGLVVILLLCCGIIAGGVFYSRRLAAKNQLLLQRITEQDLMDKENEVLRGRLILSEDLPGKEKDTGSELYLRLKTLMSDPTFFTNSEIGRKTIAEHLGTNEKYVHDTVRKYFNMSISDYITSLRLNYARKLLAQSVSKYTIEAVALDAGFTNRYTFHRLFKEHYGMTPSEFRHLTHNRQQESPEEADDMKSDNATA